MMELREAIEAFKREPKYCTAKQAILNAIIDGTLIPADAVFQVKEGYCLQAYIDNEAYEPVEWVDPSEALEIRSADDVRREAVQKCITELSEGYLNGDGLPAMVKRMSDLIDIPQPEGGDDELAAD